MKKFTFKQLSIYSADWDGELVNIPENAVFYKYYAISEEQQEWYIFINKNDVKEFEDTYEDGEDDSISMFYGHGCAQVSGYRLFDYIILHLNNIRPYEEWNDIGEEKFNQMFFPFFESCYVYEYMPAKYEFEGMDDSLLPKMRKISDEKLIAAYRLKGIETDSVYSVTKIGLFNPISRRKDYEIYNTILGMYKIEDGGYDPLHLVRRISHDGGIYDHAFHLVTDNLY